MPDRYLSHKGGYGAYLRYAGSRSQSRESQPSPQANVQGQDDERRPQSEAAYPPEQVRTPPYVTLPPPTPRERRGPRTPEYPFKPWPQQPLEYPGPIPSPTPDEVLRGQVQWQAQQIEGWEMAYRKAMGLANMMMGHVMETAQGHIPAWNQNVGTLYPVGSGPLVSQVPFPKDPKQVRTFLGDESGRQLRALDPGAVDIPSDIPMVESVTEGSHQQGGSGVASGSGFDPG